MEKTIYKSFFLWEYEKEEQWINSMSVQGWQLIKASMFKYRFEKGVPNEYTYRLELLEKGLKTEESSSYVNFLQETGIEMVGKCKNWIYLRSKTMDGGFEPSNKALYKLTHVLKIQEFIGKTRNLLVIMIAISFCGILTMEEMPISHITEFLRGFFTGIGLSGSFVSLVFLPLTHNNNQKIKSAIKELYTCE